MEAKRLLEMIADGSAVPLHIMSRESFKKAHIPTSIWIPLNFVEEHIFSGINNSKLIVPYCKNSSCMSSKIATDILNNCGFRAERYQGGIEEWVSLGMPVEHSDQTDQDEPT